MTESLLAFLNARTIRAQVHASDWRVAIARAGDLLVEDGAVEPRYIEAMQATVEEHGPYVVIAPGIALPHARPEDGVTRPALSLVTLAEPVSFGHADNDPVDLVLAFGAVDKTSHVRALQELARLLGDDDAVAGIRAARTEEELLDAIHGASADSRSAGNESTDNDKSPEGRGR